MANEHSNGCTGLSKGLWWLITLLGFLLLLLLMLFLKRGAVETDIKTRTAQELKFSNINWAQVETTDRGRDVLLSGIAATSEEVDKAVKAALTVKGVRVVENAVEVIPFKSPDLAIQTDTSGKIMLAGTMPDQNIIDKLVSSASSAFGKDKVNNQLSIGERISSPDWLTRFADLFASLKQLKIPAFNMDADSASISGTVHSDADKQSILDKFKPLFGAQLKDDIIVKILKKPELMASLQAGKIILSGTLSSQQQVDKLVTALGESVDADNIVNNLSISDEYSDKDGIITLSGSTESKDSHEAVTSSVQAVSDILKLKFTNQIELIKPEPEPEPEPVVKQDDEADKARLEAERKAREEAQRLAEEQAQAERIAKAKAEVEACQAKLNNTMAEKSILFANNKADIKKESLSLIQQIAAVITECRDKVPDMQITISGHTDSKGSAEYNLDLSQRRADAVKSQLVATRVDEAIVSATGYGETQPIASNDTAEGRAQNRRITFSVR